MIPYVPWNDKNKTILIIDDGTHLKRASSSTSMSLNKEVSSLPQLLGRAGALDLAGPHPVLVAGMLIQLYT